MLRFLGALERRRRVGEEGAGVGHRGTENEAIEAVRDVVVVRDRGRVALLRVAAATKSRLLGRRRQRPKRSGAELAQGRKKAPRELTKSPRALEDLQRLVEVTLNVKLAGYIGTSEADLAGCSRDPPKCVGRAHNDGRTAELLFERGECHRVIKLRIAGSVPHLEAAYAKRIPQARGLSSCPRTPMTRETRSWRAG